MSIIRNNHFVFNALETPCEITHNSNQPDSCKYTLRVLGYIEANKLLPDVDEVKIKDLSDAIDQYRITSPGTIDIISYVDNEKTLTRYIYSRLLSYRISVQSGKYVITDLSFGLFGNDGYDIAGETNIQSNIINFDITPPLAWYMHDDVLIVKVSIPSDKDIISIIDQKYRQFIFNGKLYHFVMDYNLYTWARVYRYINIPGKSKVAVYTGAAFIATTKELLSRDELSDAIAILDTIKLED